MEERAFAGEVADQLPCLGHLGVLARLQLNNSVTGTLLEGRIIIEAFLIGVKDFDWDENRGLSEEWRWLHSWQKTDLGALVEGLQVLDWQRLGGIVGDLLL
jgi:hypothetical protein